MTTTASTIPSVEERLEATRPAPRPRRRRRGFWIVAGLFLFVTCLMMLSPFIWTAMSVTKPTNVAFVNPPVFVYQPTLQAFVDLWETTYFYQYLINTLIVAVISTVIALLIGIPAAYALSRTPGYISVVLLTLALIFRALPRFAVVLPMYELSQRFGIYDTTYALAIALVAINQPFTIWLLRNFFAEIPKDLDEAAMIDGCTRVSMLRKVMIPLMGPGILTAGIFIFLFAFQEYLTAAILTDTASKTVPVFITTQLGQTLPMLQQAGAAAMLLTLPVIGIAFVAQKYLVAGLASGAVKG
jgi:multiple sugar transport system permease protein